MSEWKPDPAGLRYRVRRDGWDADSESRPGSSVLNFVVVDPRMSSGYLEIRSGRQRVGILLDNTNHDPGDEDRGER